jgi:hypothetical protein
MIQSPGAPEERFQRVDHASRVGSIRVAIGLPRIRRLDRVWRRKVRPRTYPFLLPGRIER